MRAIFSLLSLIALLLAMSAAVRLPKIPYAVLSVLGTQFLFTLAPWVLHQRLQQSDPRYINFCAVLGFLAMAAAVGFVMRAAWPIFGAYLSISLPAILLLSVYVSRQQEATHPAYRFSFALGFCFFWCGCITLLSLTEPSPEAWHIARKILSAFWILEGLYLWYLPANLQQDYAGWARNEKWFPAVVAFACFTFMAWKFNSIQREAAREAVRVEMAAPVMAREGVQ